MRVVITGGAGFIGANLSRHLLESGTADSVVVLDNLSTGFRSNLDGVAAEFVEGSILDPDALDQVCDGADAIVHLAARPSVPKSVENPEKSHHNNATGTLEVLQAARRAGNLHTIVASSSSVYGANPTLPKSEDLKCEPLSPYAVSKLATETYALAFQSCYDLPVLPFRFFNVFGPLQPAGHAYAAVIPAFTEAAIAGQALPVHGDGGQSRDFTYIGSLCDVMAQALTNRVTSEIAINLAFGSRYTLLDVIDELGDIVGVDLEREHLPTRAGDVRHSQADQSRLRALFPNIEPTPFRDGLEATVAWFRTLS